MKKAWVLSYLLSTQRRLWSDWATGWMPRLIWVFAGCTLTLLVLSCCSSNCTWSSKLLLVLCWTRDPETSCLILLSCLTKPWVWFSLFIPWFTFCWPPNLWPEGFALGFWLGRTSLPSNSCRWDLPACSVLASLKSQNRESNELLPT